MKQELDSWVSRVKVAWSKGQETSISLYIDVCSMSAPQVQKTPN